MYEKYGRQMKKGVLDMLVLHLLRKKPKYGYQLISEMKERSCGTFVLKEGTLYPVLYRLEEEHLVESEWNKAQGKQVARKYYKITEAGAEALIEIEKTWNEIILGIKQIMEEES